MITEDTTRIDPADRPPPPRGPVAPGPAPATAERGPPPRDIERMTRRIALLIALFLAVAVPVQYAVTRYLHEVKLIDQVGHHAARGLLRVTYLFPEVWQYQEHRLAELLQWALLDDEHMFIELVTAEGNRLGSVGRTPRLAAIERRYPVSDGDRVVAELRVRSAANTLVLETMLVAVLGLIPAALFYFGLKLVPLRLLETAWHRLRAYQGRLREEMGDKERALRRLREAQERMEFLSMHDALTGLANRNLLRQQAALTLARTRRESGRAALLLVDIDGFGAVNGRHGQAVGDHLLRVVGHRLKRMLRDADVVARLGADEFAILLTQVEADTVERLAVRIRELVARPIVTDAATINITASIGGAWYPDSATEFAMLLRKADLANERARRQPGGFEFDQTGDADPPGGIAAMAQALAQAIADRALNLVYQPIVSMDQRLVAVEALLRWHDPRFGQVAPQEFIAVAERHGLIVDLTDLLIERALGRLVTWNALHPDLQLCINLSPQLLLDESMPGRIQQLLKRHSLPASRLCLEFTEQGLMSDPVLARLRIDQYRRAGVRLALDDFGTGFSSLAQIAAMDLHVIKIDASFVREMVAQPWARNVVSCAIGIARGLNARVLAEGVESLPQWELLQELGCDLVQGYIAGEPVEADQFGRLLVRERIVLTQFSQPEPA